MEMGGDITVVVSCGKRPPTNKPRLSTLHLDHLGLELVRVAASHMNQLSGLLAPSWAVREPKGTDDDQLRKDGAL